MEKTKNVPKIYHPYIIVKQRTAIRIIVGVSIIPSADSLLNYPQ